MDLPIQFPYGPRLKTLLGCYAVGILLCAISICWRAFWIFGLMGLVPLSVALAGTFRRVTLRPYLAFKEDKFVIHRGRGVTTEIAYSGIQKIHEATHGRMRVLKLQTRERSIEINSALLPDDASFETIRDYLKERVTPQPTLKAKIPGAYACQCNYEGNGAIYDSNGELLWRFETLHFERPHYPYGVIRIPDFVVCDKDGRKIFQVGPERQWMLRARFVMTRDGSPVCAIQLRSIFRNKYTLEFANGEKWVYRMPLFSVNFGGASENGGKIRVRVRGHNIWLMFFDPEHDRPEVVSAIAFLHRERLRFN